MRKMLIIGGGAVLTLILLLSIILVSGSTLPFLSPENNGASTDEPDGIIDNEISANNALVVTYWYNGFVDLGGLRVVLKNKMLYDMDFSMNDLEAGNITIVSGNLTEVEIQSMIETMRFFAPGNHTSMNRGFLVSDCQKIRMPEQNYTQLKSILESDEFSSLDDFYPLEEGYIGETGFSWISANMGKSYKTILSGGNAPELMYDIFILLSEFIESQE